MLDTMDNDRPITLDCTNDRLHSQQIIALITSKPLKEVQHSIERLGLVKRDAERVYAMTLAVRMIVIEMQPLNPSYS